MGEASARGVVLEPDELASLVHDLDRLVARLLEVEEEHGDLLQGMEAEPRTSTTNLLHYLALRQCDIRPLQEQLTRLGLSSLGRAEADVLNHVRTVLQVVQRLASDPAADAHARHAPAPAAAGGRLLEQRACALLGPKPESRRVRIMVTMPSEAAQDYHLVREFLSRGMDCMRINCAHDDAAAWERMIEYLRRAERELGRSCRVLMDLAGPKVRTGPIEPAPAVAHWKPARDALGRVRSPVRIWLTPGMRPQPPPPGMAACLPVDAPWLVGLAVGDRVELVDARRARRRLRIVARAGASRVAECEQTAYVVPGTVLRVVRARDAAQRGLAAVVGDLPRLPGTLVLRPGDRLRVMAAHVMGTAAARDRHGRLLRPATVSCMLPEVLARVRPGDPIWFDDGKIGGIVRRARDGVVHVEITRAKPGGSKLHADRGINFPGTELQLPALTNKDLADLPFVAAHADVVGLSFVQSPADVREVQSRLRTLGAGHRSICLKIETRRAFEQLPQLLLAALRGPDVSVLIARGDLAVECGWERLAELQEEILWICEAAHVPVVWATQVLESLAKTGLPSRPEITDAAMSSRAECVMLNKGPHTATAIGVLDDILRRMERHQSKKTPRLNRLRSWSGYEPARLERLDQPWDAGGTVPPSDGALGAGGEVLPSDGLVGAGDAVSGPNSRLSSQS